MPRHMRGSAEKSKDFKGSMIKIIKSLKTWYTPIIISLVLALISAILALIAPNKLSTLADTITAGITPRISESTIKNIMQKKTRTIITQQAFVAFIFKI